MSAHSSKLSAQDQARQAVPRSGPYSSTQAYRPLRRPETVEDKDACAIYASVRRDATPSHEPVILALESLQKMLHRAGNVDDPARLEALESRADSLSQVKRRTEPGSAQFEHISNEILKSSQDITEVARRLRSAEFDRVARAFDEPFSTGEAILRKERAGLTSIRSEGRFRPGASVQVRPTRRSVCASLPPIMPIGDWSPPAFHRAAISSIT